MPNTAGSTAQISGLTEYASRCFLDMYCKRTLCIFQVIYLSMRLQRKYCNNNLKGNCYVSSGQTKTDVIRMSVVQRYECHTNFQITCIWWKIEMCFLVLFNRNQCNKIQLQRASYWIVFGLLATILTVQESFCLSVSQKATCIQPVKKSKYKHHCACLIPPQVMVPKPQQPSTNKQCLDLLTQ